MLSKIGFGALEPVGLENWRPPRDCAVSQGCINLIPTQAIFMYNVDGAQCMDMVLFLDKMDLGDENTIVEHYEYA